ncbi:MAG: hypothetical protein Q8Q85_08490 [Gemmatimonadales bacterium]|nr:hypothetical protein [Gemmatimonadales bacterium]
MTEMVAGGSPPRQEILEALRLLEQQGVVEPTYRKWRLRRKSWEELGAQVIRRRERVLSILDRHFPADLDRSQLARWFDDACVSFFVTYGDRWVAAITRKTPIIGAAGPSLGSVVKTTATNVGLQARVDALISGFKRFLDSSLPEDTEHLWSLGMATFASRLVCAGIGADPISTRELRDSMVFLDTNALLAIALEASRPAAAFQALGEALRAINAQLFYCYPTREEYRRVVSRWTTDTLRVIDRYGTAVLEDSEDPWIKTAVGRYCRDRADYQRFFDQIMDPPVGIGDQLRITLLDEPDVAKAAAGAEEDKQLVTQIQTHWRERRHRPKPIHLARHDAAVTGVVRHLLERGDRAWVLTLDLTMHDLALRWAGPTGTPLWVSLDPLLQILAVDQSGTKVDAVQFGPILARLISNEVEVSQATYAVEDLRWLDEIHRDVKELPKETVQELAREIHAARMAGAKRNDPELRLKIERAYQRATAKLVADHGEARVIVAQALDEKAQVETSRKRIEDIAREEVEIRLERAARNRLLLRVLGCLLLGLSTAWGVRELFGWAWEGGSRRDLLSLILPLSGLVIPPFALVWSWALPSYRSEIRDVPDKARLEVAERTSTKW